MQQGDSRKRLRFKHRFYRFYYGHRDTFGKYLVAGVFGTVTQLSLSWLFGFFLKDNWAIGTAAFFGHMVNFIAQKFWAFESGELHEIRNELPGFIAGAIVSSVAMARGSLWLLSHEHINKFIGQLIVGAMLTPIFFFVNKKIFKTSVSYY